jgi:hypothetical protein
MQQGLDAIKLALRVLTAITDKQNPDASDVQWLRQYAPLLADLPPDELACEVVQEELARRREYFRAVPPLAHSAYSSN